MIEREIDRRLEPLLILRAYFDVDCTIPVDDLHFPDWDFDEKRVFSEFYLRNESPEPFEYVIQSAEFSEDPEAKFSFSDYRIFPFQVVKVTLEASRKYYALFVANFVDSLDYNDGDLTSEIPLSNVENPQLKINGYFVATYSEQEEGKMLQTVRKIQREAYDDREKMAA
jgi:hypothetical protein